MDRKIEVGIYIDQAAIERGTNFCQLIGVKTEGEYAFKDGKTYAVGEKDYESPEEVSYVINLSNLGEEFFKVGISPFVEGRYSMWLPCQMGNVDPRTRDLALEVVSLREEIVGLIGQTEGAQNG
ncbi:hypothetical protein HYS91_00905 [Candidatus Daviesbacteria bacterium]|nr:hypothetical protein [Candidatus Daviesbacteria bacterium]